LTSPDHDAAPTHSSSAGDAGASRRSSGVAAAGLDLAQWEKAMIERAMREAAGNQTKAAQRLGISRTRCAIA